MRMLFAVVVLMLAALGTTLSLYFFLTADKRAREAGKAQAERDIEHGSLKWKAWGRHRPWWNEWMKLMNERLGVEVQFVDNRETSAMFANASGYNDRMRRELESRFGAGVVESLYQEAAERYAAMRAGVNLLEL